MTTAPRIGPSVSVDVYKLQCALRKDCIGCLTVDGRWGPDTQATLDQWIAMQSPDVAGPVWYTAPARGATSVVISTGVGVGLFSPLRSGECDRPRAAPSLTPTATPAEPAPATAPMQPWVPAKLAPSAGSRWGWWLFGAAVVVGVGGAVYYARKRR